MILSWSERMISHTGTETRPRRFRAAAVRNFGQWAKAWSSYIAWMKKAQLVVKFIFSLKIMTLMKWTVPANSVPAAAVIRGGRALFEMIGRKEHVDGFLSRHSDRYIMSVTLQILTNLDKSITNLSQIFDSPSGKSKISRREIFDLSGFVRICQDLL